MPKVVLGKTPEQIQAEEAQKQRELEEAIQQRDLERRAKLQALRQKQKVSRIIVVSIFVVFCIALLTFGTYNTFFKHPLTQQEVLALANSVGNKFPCEGIPNYVRDNADPLFQQYITYNRNIYSEVYVDANTVEVSKIKKYSNTMVEVFFSADVVMIEKDQRVTDEELIAQLQRNGLNMTADPTDIMTEEDITATIPANCLKLANGSPIMTVDGRYIFYQVDAEGNNLLDDGGHPLVYAQNADGTPATDAEGHIYYYAVLADGTLDLDSANHPQIVQFNENWLPLINEDGNGVVMEEQPTLDPVAPPTPTPTPEPSASITTAEQTNNAGETVEYYMTTNGNIYQRGREIRVRYEFTLPVEYATYYDIDGQLSRIIPEGHYASEYTIAVTAYRVCGQLNMYSLSELNQTNFEQVRQNFNSSVPSANLQFNSDTRLSDQDGALDIKAKVSNILQQLYSGTATTNVFENYREFNTWGATYNGIDDFYYYTQPNELGFNAYCIYSITTPQGFTYEVYMYMTIEDMGSGNYKITAIL